MYSQGPDILTPVRPVRVLLLSAADAMRPFGQRSSSKTCDCADR